MNQLAKILGLFILLGCLIAGCNKECTNSTSPTTSSNIKITGITPDSSIAGWTVVISGKGFGTSKNSGYVMFNDVIAPAVSFWSDTLIAVQIPYDAASGKVTVHVKSDESNGYDFVVLLTPFIKSVSPLAGKPGDLVTITGENFGSVQGNSALYMDQNAISVESWSDTKVTFKVPASDKHLVHIYLSVNNVSSQLVPFIISSGGSSASPLTGLWYGKYNLQTSGTMSYYLYLDEQGGMISGNGIQVIDDGVTGEFYSDFSITGVLYSTYVGLMGTIGGSNWVCYGTLSLDKSTINGNINNQQSIVLKKM